MHSSSEITDQILEALEALDHEIQTVLERPSQDRLFQGKRQKKTTSDKATDYLFETKNMSIRHAEEIKATVENKVYTAQPVSYEKQQLVLRFPENLGAEIGEVDLEWENDFVLRRNRERLEQILETPGLHSRLEMLFDADAKRTPSTRDIKKNQQNRDSVVEDTMGSDPKGHGYVRTLYLGPTRDGKNGYAGIHYCELPAAREESVVCIQYESGGGCRAFECSGCTFCAKCDDGGGADL
jgi:hypothetical protein